MDNVTHAIAGLLLAQAAVAHIERRTREPAPVGVRRAATILGVVAAELPDADLLYAGPALGMGKLGYLLHHRGHTHTVVFAVLAALLIWGVAMAVRPALRASPVRGTLLALTLAGTLVTHLALDFTNSYGVHPWWPVSNAWHYGDAVFIIEPWLWVAALPPLALLARSMAAHVAYMLVLFAILAVAWAMDMVGRDVAIALTLAAVAWGAATWWVRPARRLAMGLAAWVVVEGVFFAASSSAKRQVESVVASGPMTLEGAALSPAVGNPLCFDALVMERDATTYRVTAARVATVPALRGAASCQGRAELGATARAATPAVRWGEAWSAPVGELLELARGNCEVAAALRFIRVPVWERLPDGGVRVADLRYSRGAGGFAEIISTGRPVACPHAVPPWDPPRATLLVDTLPRGDVD